MSTATNALRRTRCSYPHSNHHPSARTRGSKSRSTPDHIVIVIESLGRALAEAGWTLRTAAASSARSAFERGCAAVDGQTETVALRTSRAEAASTTAEQCWPETLLPWDQLSASTRALLAQRSCQILGPDLDAPAKFVAFWKPTDGRAFEIEHALQIAAAHAVPCVRIEQPMNLSRLIDWAAQL